MTARPQATGSETTRRGGLNTTAILTSLVFFCAGTLLMILPWSAFWESNHFLPLWPPLETILLHDVTRIAVTGLGVMDFVLGVSEMQRVSHQSEPEQSPGP